MTRPGAAGGLEPQRSPRVRLARAARAAALEVAGVAGLGSHPHGATFDADDPIAGVLAVAGSNAGYDLTLHLVAEPVPLPELAVAVRAAVRDAARGEGLEAELGRVDVVIEDLTEAGASR